MAKKVREALSPWFGIIFILWTALQLCCVALDADAKDKPVKPGDPNPNKFLVRVFPKMNMEGAPRLMITAEVRDMGENEYCPGVRVEWGQGQSSEVTQDCPPYEEWLRQIGAYDACIAEVQAAVACVEQIIVCPQGMKCIPDCSPPPKECKQPAQIRTSWTWKPSEMGYGYGPGDHHLRVVFWLGNDKRVEATADFYVGGEGGQ